MDFFRSIPGKTMRQGMSACGRMILAAALILQLSGATAAFAGDKPVAKAADPLMATMKGELARATKELAKAEPKPYFISYTVYDQEMEVLVASFGGLVNNIGMKRRQADVVMRVGSPALDNTHNQSRESGMTSGSLPIENNADAIARSLWELTDREYKQAAPAYLNVKTNTAVRAEEEDKSPDFSRETARVNEGATAAAPKFDHPAWEERLRRLSGAFRKYAEVYSAVVVLQVQSGTSRLVSSEGTEITTPGASARLLIEAQTRADDGMELLRVETFQAPTPDELPGEAELLGKIEIVARDLQALRKAPVAEPFDGPAMLSGRASAVFFHEVLGHRLEGHRQRDEDEGQTFTKKVGEEVLPKFLSVADDPTLGKYGSVKLAGSYSYDDEGQPAQRVEVIQNGVLKNFLMSRMPIKNFLKSNGHGRNQPGSMPTGRQGNLIVSSANAVPDAELRKRLIEEVKKQKKPYGLFFDDVQGGFTLTTRSLPQAFQVLPVMVYRVYADGRPDELVRGVDIVGTPLAALTRIMVTGDSPQVFNGVCGAESGSVPVAAVAPAMLFSEMEVQKRAHSHTRPPILPPPGFETPPAGPGTASKQGVKP